MSRSSNLRRLPFDDCDATNVYFTIGARFTIGSPFVMTVSPSDEPPQQTLPRERKAVLVADLVDSVRLMQRDEADTVERWSRFVAEVRRELLPARGGRLIKSMGDGFLLVFDQVPAAAAAALDLHRRIATYNRQRGDEAAFYLRVGTNVGEVFEDTLDVYGDAVNITARVSVLAGPGETVVTADFRDGLVAGVDADVEDLGDCFLKHVTGPVRAFRLGAASPAPVLDSFDQRRSNDLRPGIAVIPFECSIGHDPGSMLGEALADEVISHLARSPELHVISGLSTRGMKGRRLTVEEIAAHLGAAYVVSGRYRMHDDKVRLNLELADARNRHVLWADGFDTTVREAFDPEQALAHRIVQLITHALRERELERATTQPLPTLESYTLLFGAISLMHRLSPGDFDLARQMLDELAHRHGRSAVAHAWLAKWHVLRAAQGWSPDPNAEVTHALGRVQRALDANPRDGLALAVGGLVQAYLLKDLTAAGRYYEDALIANPNESLAWLFSSTLSAYRGEGSDAEQAAEMAMRLSPLDPMKYFIDSLAATAVAGNHNWVKSEALSLRSLRANRTHASTWRTLIYAQVMQDKMDEARKSVQELRRIEPSYSVSVFRERFPGRGGPMAAPWAEAMSLAGLPD